MAIIAGIILMIIGGLIFNANKDNDDDPNWVAIVGIVIFLAGLGAIGTIFS